MSIYLWLILWAVLLGAVGTWLINGIMEGIGPVSGLKDWRSWGPPFVIICIIWWLVLAGITSIVRWVTGG